MAWDKMSHTVFDKAIDNSLKIVIIDYLGDRSIKTPFGVKN